MTGRDGELILALADNERLGKDAAALELAFAYRAALFEGMPRGNAIRLDDKSHKEEGE